MNNWWNVAEIAPASAWCTVLLYCITVCPSIDNYLFKNVCSILFVLSGVWAVFHTHWWNVAEIAPAFAWCTALLYCNTVCPCDNCLFKNVCSCLFVLSGVCALWLSCIPTDEKWWKWSLLLHNALLYCITVYSCESSRFSIFWDSFIFCENVNKNVQHFTVRLFL